MHNSEASTAASKKLSLKRRKAVDTSYEGTEDAGQAASPISKRRKRSVEKTSTAIESARRKRGKITQGATNSGTAVETSNEKMDRFIVFIGNLPFSATKEAVTKHFAAVRPKSVRVLTHKEDPSKCKGFAFLEFGKYDTMKSCLEKFHHSPFEDGVSEARKLNVELTAGGGGKSRARATKLKVKNQKLSDQRKRKAQSKTGEQLKHTTDAGIHPSRRNHFKKERM